MYKNSLIPISIYCLFLIRGCSCIYNSLTYKLVLRGCRTPVHCEHYIAFYLQRDKKPSITPQLSLVYMGSISVYINYTLFA